MAKTKAKTSRFRCCVNEPLALRGSNPRRFAQYTLILAHT